MTINWPEYSYNCPQCFDSYNASNCTAIACEARFKETGSLYKKDKYDWAYKQVGVLLRELPSGFKVTLQDETREDIACDWRRYLIIYQDECMTIRVPTYQSGASYSNMIEREIKSRFDKKETKMMTRKEAYAVAGTQLVDQLERLGVLQLEEEMQHKYAASTLLMKQFDKPINEVLDAVKVLEHYNYKIVDADKYDIVEKRK